MWGGWRLRVGWALLAVLVLASALFIRHEVPIVHAHGWIAAWHGLWAWEWARVVWVWENIPLWTWFTRTSILSILAVIGWYVVREIRREVLIFDPFGVPKRFEEAGVTSKALTSRIGSAMQRMEDEALTSMKKDALGFAHIEGGTPEIEIPGTKIALRSMVEFMRNLLGIHPVHVGGNVCFESDLASAGKDGGAGSESVTVTVYVTHGRTQREVNGFKATSSNLDGLVRSAAELALEHVNPCVFGAYLRGQKRSDEALAIARKVAEDVRQTSSNRSGGFCLWGVLLSDQKKNKIDVEMYELALQHNPKNVAAWNNLGILLMDQKDYAGAIKRYRAAIAIDSRYKFPYYNWGLCLEMQKDYKRSIALYKRVPAIDPNYVDASLGWGNCLYEQKDYQGAITHYESALKIDPNHVTAHNNCGNALREKKDYPEAIAHYESALNIDPNYVDAYFNWACALCLMDRYAEAVPKFEKTLDLAPEFERAGELLEFARSMMSEDQDPDDFDFDHDEGKDA